MTDKTKIQLLSIGDATMDVFLEPTEHEELCMIDSKECFICFSYGDKIPVKHLEYSVGGNAANNAVGTKRLGINSALVATLGTDPTGNAIVSKMKDEGVNLDFTIQQEGAESNFSNIINYGGERTIFSYHAPRSYEFPIKLPAAPWAYLTSMGETFKAFYNHFVEWKDKHPEVKLAFNPGSRQLRAGLEDIEPVMRLTTIIYVNRHEAESLMDFGDSSGKDKELLKKLSELGPKVCIVTDGGNGSLVYISGKTGEFGEERFIKAGILPVDSFERTGAGDGFGAGCIAALIKGKSFEEALLWGTSNSASVIGYTGSQKGLLDENGLQMWLERAKSSEVKVEEF